MRKPALLCCLLLATLHLCAWAQNAPTPEQRAPQPLYQVTIVSRTTKAINYGYLAAPTRIGFQGTPVVPSASGKATIEPKRGSTVVKIDIKDLPAPGRFGPQYLAYVVWAISPDGRAQNLGELMLDGSTKGKLSTSTPLQTFAMIVTAEPHYAVSQPGDIVVMENVVISETIGKVQEVNATYELLPRQPYTFNAAAAQLAPTGQPVSSAQYESITALYQALNAIQIAQSQNADRYAADQMLRARQLYNKARGFPVNLSKEIVSMAREATQIAEDARVVAVRRASAEKAGQNTTPAEPPSATPTEGHRGREAEKPVQQPSQPQAYVEPAPSPTPAITPSSAEQEDPVVVDHSQFQRDDPNARENRRRLLAALPRDFEVLDSGRGVVLTIPENAASSSMPRSYFTAVATAIKPYPRLHLSVEAHRDTPDSLNRTESEAMRVRDALIGAGVSPEVVIAHGYGNTRPRASNATNVGAAQNRRVEILISGDSIGILPTWDKTYKLQMSQGRS